MNDRSATWTLRADLNVQRVEFGHESFWILQDPLSRQMHYVNAREFALLELLDGRRTLDDLMREIRFRFAPDHLCSDALVLFLADARRRDLITGGIRTDSAGSWRTDEKTPTSPMPWWKQPLAIRVPGINPDPIIDPLASHIGRLLTPVSAIILSALICVALAMVVTQFSLLSDHFVDASRGTRPSWVLAIAVVIGMTKIVHELAHAVTCKAFGAECREIGLMFLVGIPCLYCDVSDAWMLPQRRKRIMISAAGMTAEIAIASVATVLWWFSAEGPLRDVCVTIMVVCSVSTLVFNGNPLLRYDGYYILSDLVGIPNLGHHARRALRDSVQSFLWGATVSVREASDTLSIEGHGNRPAREWFLLSYAIASGLYRLIVYTTIAYFLYRFAERFGFGPFCAMLLVTYVVLTVARVVADWWKPPESEMVTWSPRPIVITAAVVLLVGTALSLPLRRTVIAPAMICPAEPHEMYATVGGRIVRTVRYGADVQRGQEVALLENADERQELLRLQAECARLRIEIDVLQNQRTSDSIAAAKLPSTNEALRSAEKQLELQRRQMQRLTIRAPVAGTVFAGDQRRSDSLFVDRVSDPRRTLPFSPQRRGGWVEAGDHVCVIGSSDRRDVVLWVGQQDISLIQLGTNCPAARRGQQSLAVSPGR